MSDPRKTRWTPNEIVGYRMRVARQRKQKDGRGWTQKDAREALQDYGLDWSEAVYSAAERSEVGRTLYDDRGRVRQFDADEILALAAAFGVSPLWFFLPPGATTSVRHPDAKRGGSLTVGDLLELAIGTGSRFLEADLRTLAERHRPDLLEEVGPDALEPLWSALEERDRANEALERAVQETAERVSGGRTRGRLQRALESGKEG